MKSTRRELLSRSASVLLASVAVAAPQKRQKWQEDQLGIMCHLGAKETSARDVIATARAAGFRRAQIDFPWARVDSTYLGSLPSWLKGEGLQAEVLSAYVNCCHPETVVNECRPADFARAIDFAATLGCRHLVAWTGGYSTSLQQSEPRNLTPAATDAIRRFLDKYTPALQGAGLNLALESYITLACPDAPSLRGLLDRLPNCVGAVMDPPNLTPLGRFSERDQVLREMFTTLRGRVGVVHLKDFRLAPEGGSYILPGPLGGEMNYPLFIDQILALPDSPPLVVEHVKPEQFAETRRKLVPVFEAVARQRTDVAR